MSILTVRVTRKDFREAVKACRTQGHDLCRCVVAKAVIRTDKTLVPTTVSVGLNGYTARDGEGRYISRDCTTGNQNRVVNLFDHLYQKQPADKIYREVKDKGMLKLAFKPSFSA